MGEVGGMFVLASIIFFIIGLIKCEIPKVSSPFILPSSSLSFINLGSLKNIRVLKKNMLFIQSYDDEINKCTLKSHSFYETCGSVEKIKLKENYKNHTAYVTYQDAQSAAAAFIVRSPSPRLFSISTTA